MRVPSRSAPLAAFALALALAATTCAFPTDKSDAVFVTIDLPKQVVLRGQKSSVYAHMWQRMGADSVEILNVDFDWSSGDDSIATVKEGGLGSADVTGVNSGVVGITARAVAFEKAENASVTVRVSNPLEVDSVRPSLVRFGDTITVYGVGVDSIFLAFLDNATMLDYPIPQFLPTRTRDSLGFSTATFWVPPPAHTSQLSFIGPGVFGSARDTTRVLPFDLLEPNETAPRSIALDGPPRFPQPQLQFLKFFNPALAFELPRRDEKIGVEWYRFTQTTSRDLTLILSGPAVRGTFSTFLTDSLYFNPPDTGYYVGPSSWTVGPRSHFCKGFAFEPPQTQPESTIVALAGMPAGALHAVALYTQPGPYGLAVLQGYITSDATVPRDSHEEDDFCNAADARGLAVSLPGSFRDTLTIDNAHDVDWIRFRVSSPATVTLKVASLASAVTDTSDVDLYLLTVPGPSLTVAARSTVFRSSTEQITVPLVAGDYYAVVVDYIGAPVRYALCIDTSACALFPSPPHVAPVSAARRAAKPVLPAARTPRLSRRP